MNGIDLGGYPGLLTPGYFGPGVQRFADPGLFGHGQSPFVPAKLVSYGMDDDARAFLDAMFSMTTVSTQSSASANKMRVIGEAVDHLVKDLKSSGIWSLCVAIWPMVGSAAQSTVSGNFYATSLNLKNPSFTTAAFCLSQAVTNTDQGIANSTTGAVDTGVKGSNLSNFDWHFAWYDYRQKGVSRPTECIVNQTGTGRISINLAENDFNWTCNGQSTDLFVGFSSGFYIVTRTSTTSVIAYYNGVNVGSNTASVATNLPNTNYSLMRDTTSGANSHSDFISFASIGNGISSDLAMQFTLIIQRFETRLGRAI